MGKISAVKSGISTIKSSGIKSAAGPKIGEKTIPLSVNPLDEAEKKHTGDIEKDTDTDNAEMLNQFEKVRSGEEQQRQAVALANDTRHWCALYFQSHEQKMEFLKHFGLDEHGVQYLDGEFVSEALGKKLTPRTVPYKVGRTDAKLKELT